MKDIIKNNSKRLVVVVLLALVWSCNLEVQKQYEIPKSNFGDDKPFKDVTVWDWLQTKKTPTGGTYNPENFDFLIKAIEITGLENEYKYTGTDRTYFLLNNESFTFFERVNNASVAPNYTTVANVGVIRMLISSTTTLPNTGLTTFDLATLNTTQKDKLRNILKYHIVTSYIDQENVLPEKTKNYEFKTLLDGGDKGRIFVSRSIRLEIVLNGIPAEGPVSNIRPLASAKYSVARFHNYIFKNGIGHHLNRNTYYRDQF